MVVQRYRIRESIIILRTDPLRRSLRWHQAVTRRTYSVKGANSLWHIDGLIRWRFVVHGGVDGYSRLVVYLTCNTNNESQTVINDVFIELHKIMVFPRGYDRIKGVKMFLYAISWLHIMALTQCAILLDRLLITKGSLERCIPVCSLCVP